MNGTNAALFAPGIGDTLPNGAVVEAIRLNHNPADPDHLGYGVVLANRGTKYEPWVTWAVGIEVLAGVAEICTVWATTLKLWWLPLTITTIAPQDSGEDDHLARA